MGRAECLTQAREIATISLGRLGPILVEPPEDQWRQAAVANGTSLAPST